MNSLQKRIRAFLKDGRQASISLQSERGMNVLYMWSRVINPFRLITNHMAIQVGKYFPLRLKITFFRFVLGMGIGRNVGIAPDTDIDPYYPELITIGDNAVLGWKVKILCHEFTRDRMTLGRVKIGENTLIGAFTSIRAGVTIGKDAVIAMNSYVNKDIPDNGFFGGIPARRLKVRR